MFDSLQDGLKGAFKSLRGKGKLTEGNMRDGLKMVENSLLEADVSIDVIRSFMTSVTEKALGEKVLLALDPSEQLVKVVNDELIELLGPVQSELTFDGDLSIIMMCGLQGAGKQQPAVNLLDCYRNKPALHHCYVRRTCNAQPRSISCTF